MALNHSPKIVTDGLVFYYDMNNTKKSWIGRPTTNVINPTTTGIFRYNNPGFSGAEVNSGNTYKGSPIYELTFQAQDSSYISRLGSNEGFGAYHIMGIPLQANTRYLASIYFKSDYPLSTGTNQGFINNYSNISGWGANGTSTTRYQEDGWTRLYTQFFANVNGYHSRTLTYPQQYGNGTTFVVNTTAIQNVDVSLTVQSSGIPDFTYLHAIVGASPSILDNGGLTGLSIVDHGLDTTSFTKLSWPSNIKLKAELPFTYHFRLSVPSTGGNNVNIRLASNFVSYLTAVIDNKFWKVTFDTTNLTTSTTIKTYWACPMIEQHDVVYPSTFTLNTRTNTQSVLDLTNNNTVTVQNLSYVNDGTFNFDGIDDYISLGTSIQLTNNLSLSVWHRNPNTGFIIDQGNIDNDPTGCLEWTNYGLSLNANNLAGGVTASASLTTANWNNVVCTFASGLTNFYLNGELIQSTNTSFTSFSPQGQILKIGRRAFNTSSIFSGTIGNVQIYNNKVLSASEVRQNFNALRGRYGI